MAKDRVPVPTDEPPGIEVPAETQAAEPKSEPKSTRKVITDDRLGAVNDIMRVLSEYPEEERKTIIRIVNILVEPTSPDPSPIESE